MSLLMSIYLHAEVTFQLTVDEYRSSEVAENIPVLVSKNFRLANPVTLQLTPYNVSEAERTGQPLPSNIPPDDNPSSPNRAKCKLMGFMMSNSLLT